MSYQRPITDADKSHLMPSEQAKSAIPILEQAWKEEKIKINKDGSKKAVNLVKVIIKVNLAIMPGSNLLKLDSIVFIQSRPFITGLLVAFATDLSQPGWKGSVYLLAGVTCTHGDECIDNYVEHLCMSTALRLNICLKNAVFKKVNRKQKTILP